MSVHYIIQEILNTNKCTESSFVNYNTLLHVSTLLGHPHGETFRCRYTRLHYTFILNILNFSASHYTFYAYITFSCIPITWYVGSYRLHLIYSKKPICELFLKIIV
jgi:hypothetical protein